VLPLREPAQHQAGDERCNYAPRCPFAVSLCWTERPSRQAAPGLGAVACHRFPEWRDEIPPAADARARPRWAVPNPRVDLETVIIEPGRRNVIDGALRGEDR
jgi:hypothetical protein